MTMRTAMQQYDEIVRISTAYMGRKPDTVIQDMNGTIFEPENQSPSVRTFLIAYDGCAGYLRVRFHFNGEDEVSGYWPVCEDGRTMENRGLRQYDPAHAFEMFRIMQNRPSLAQWAKEQENVRVDVGNLKHNRKHYPDASAIARLFDTRGIR